MTKIIENSKKEYLSCTNIIYIMSITGFMANYMLRVNISIAIVDMVDTNLTLNGTRFNWSVVEKTDLLGIFFWGLSPAGMIGGRLAEKYGSRLTLGLELLVASLITIFFPISCRIHYNLAMVLRVLLGASLGAAIPGMLPLCVNWIPPLDSSKFSSNLMAQGIGISITLALGGYLITYCGWESVFYVTGCLGLIWCSVWFYTIYDSPDLHPRVSDDEKNRIGESMKEQHINNTRKPSSIPWKGMFKSPPFWAIIVGILGNTFYHFTFINQLPTYLHDVLNFNISENGWFSCLPYIGYYIFGCFGSHIADHLRKSKKLSTTNTRRLFTIFTFFIPSILMLTLAFVKVHSLTAIALLTLIHSFKGCVASCYIANTMDIAPNFSATIFGSGLILGSLGGWLGNKMVGLLTQEASDFESWKNVFIIISLVNFFAGGFYFVFVSGDVQDWNHIKEEVEDGEAKALNISEDNKICF